MNSFLYDIIKKRLKKGVETMLEKIGINLLKRYNSSKIDVRC